MNLLADSVVLAAFGVSGILCVLLVGLLYGLFMRRVRSCEAECKRTREVLRAYKCEPKE